VTGTDKILLPGNTLLTCKAALRRPISTAIKTDSGTKEIHVGSLRAHTKNIDRSDLGGFDSRISITTSLPVPEGYGAWTLGTRRRKIALM
jgi:hypothetical protein